MILNNYTRLFNNSEGSYEMTNISGTNTTGVSGWSTGLGSGQADQKWQAVTGAYYGYGDTSGSGYKNKCWVDVGFSDTPESPTDYQLADSNFTNRKLTPSGGSVLTHSNRELISVQTVYLNSGSESVTVKEVGYVANPCWGTASSGQNRMVLFCRKVLDTPIVIAPGESYSFNYRIRIKDN